MSRPAKSADLLAEIGGVASLPKVTLKLASTTTRLALCTIYFGLGLTPSGRGVMRNALAMSQAMKLWAWSHEHLTTLEEGVASPKQLPYHQLASPGPTRAESVARSVARSAARSAARMRGSSAVKLEPTTLIQTARQVALAMWGCAAQTPGVVWDEVDKSRSPMNVIMSLMACISHRDTFVSTAGLGLVSHGATVKACANQVRGVMSVQLVPCVTHAQYLVCVPQFLASGVLETVIRACGEVAVTSRRFVRPMCPQGTDGEMR